MPTVLTPLTVARQLPALARRLPHLIAHLPHLAESAALGHVGLGWALEYATARHPRDIAVRCQGATLSYAELNYRANRVAHFYAGQGLRKGDVVAVLLENRPEFLAVIAGLAKIGVVAALLNTSQTGRVLTHSITLVAPRALIVGEELRASLEPVLPDIGLAPDALHWLADRDGFVADAAPAGFFSLGRALLACRVGNPRTTRDIDRGDGLFYIYTSGTTGLPKAAILSHGRWTMAYHGMGLVQQLDRRDVFYCTLPLYHGTALIVCWGAVLHGGAAIALRRKFSAREFWNDCRAFGATAFGYVGELCRYLMEQPPTPEDRAHRVRKITGNGLRPTIWSDFKERFGILEVLEFYGSSEGNIGFSNIFNFDNTVGVCPVPYAIVAWDAEREAPVRDSAGRMRRVARGEVGLLIGKITARNGFEGYTDSSKNAACLLHDVFEAGDCYFNTADLLRDIGFRHAQFVDRTGDTFRWKGENVSTAEVENVIAAVEGLASVVYGVEVPGTNGRAGMAAIAGTIDLAALLAHLRRELPPYAIPLFLRECGQLATTATFKPQKHGLKVAGFDPAQTTPDVVHVLLPGNDGYVVLTPEIHARILAGAYRF
ncbi:MAG: Long-chain-fatty-acid--CoA ligase FadD17 [Moraxellaceae bacterium]|jgi:citronellyl-CoA synthetase|nr:Long-chain-fatty-acid--CoA ligase FadD17 [Moraxellaceae bacterium]